MVAGGTNGNPTIGEVARRVDRMEQDFNRRLKERDEQVNQILKDQNEVLQRIDERTGKTATDLAVLTATQNLTDKKDSDGTTTKRWRADGRRVWLVTFVAAGAGIIGSVIGHFAS